MINRLPYDVVGIEAEACSGVADVDLPGCRGGYRSESDSTEQGVRGEHHGVIS